MGLAMTDDRHRDDEMRLQTPQDCQMYTPNASVRFYFLIRILNICGVSWVDDLVR